MKVYILICIGNHEDHIYLEVCANKKDAIDTAVKYHFDHTHSIKTYEVIE